jgi:hypothetical protein
MRDGCIDQFDHMNCGAAVAFCDAQLSTAMWASGQLNQGSLEITTEILSILDVRSECVRYLNGLCFLEIT